MYIAERDHLRIDRGQPSSWILCVDLRGRCVYDACGDFPALLICRAHEKLACKVGVVCCWPLRDCLPNKKVEVWSGGLVKAPPLV